MKHILVLIVAGLATGLEAASSAGVPAGCDPSVMSERYWEIWNEAEQAKIEADIERNRKADCEVSLGVKGEAGGVTNGTAVTVEQISSDFGFGAHIFNFNQLGRTDYNAAYKASYGAGGLFNRATVSFYWIDHEPMPGALRFDGDYCDTEDYWNGLARAAAMRNRFWRRPAPGPVIDFLKAKDVLVHGHVLIWSEARPYWIYDQYCPENEKRVVDAFGVSRHSAHYGWEPCGRNSQLGYLGIWAREWRTAYDRFDERELAAKIPVFTANMRRLFATRVASVAAHYGDVVDSWDVVNESAGDWRRYRNSHTGLALWKSEKGGLMPGDYPLRSLLDAKAAFPDSVLLCINDFRVNEDYLGQVGNLLREGAKIDVVGCQMHIFDTNASLRLSRGEPKYKWVGTPQTIEKSLDLMAQAGRPIHVSEVTIAAPGVDASARQIQAILTRNIYRKWFSHPKTTAITWWNTVDGAAVAGEPLVSGLFTETMEKKPVYYALDELINREWKTRLKVKVEVEGERRMVKFRGFRGRYRLKWRDAAGTERTRYVEVK